MQELQYTHVNGRKITALPFVLEALLKADAELKQLGIGYKGKNGLYFQGETTCSWRSLATQKQLVAKGVSWTLYSNHRRGSAIDVAADWDYIGRIKPTMVKYGFINDLAQYGDGGHFNWGSNTQAAKYPIIDQQVIIKKFSMNQYEGEIIMEAEQSGAFALVQDGKRRLISQKRAGLAALLPGRNGKDTVPVNKAIWDSIPEGEAF